jgi:hypothetical protein
VLAVAIAAVSALAAPPLPACHPLWAGITMGFDVLVIYAVTVHGAELQANR